jgi:hypothetical protein
VLLISVGSGNDLFDYRVYEPDWSIGTYGRLQEVRLKSVRHGDLSKQLLDQLLDPPADLVTDGLDDIYALTGRVVERPVLVAFPRIVRTTVTASHRDDHVTGLDCVDGEDCGFSAAMSMPSSAIACTATGLILSAGSLPADRTSMAPPESCFRYPAAI